MRKLIAFSAAMLTAVCLAGNNGSNGRTSGNVQPWDGGTYFYAYEAGVFTIDKDGDMLLKLYQPASKNGKVVSDFGYYFVTGEDKDRAVSLITKVTGSGKPVLEGNTTYTVQDLKRGDSIGFYVKYSDDSAVYSQASRNGSDLFFPLTNTKKDVDYYTFGQSGSWEDGGVLAFVFEGFRFPEQQHETPDGQPLPDTGTTVLVGAWLILLVQSAYRYVHGSVI